MKVTKATIIDGGLAVEIEYDFSNDVGSGKVTIVPRDDGLLITADGRLSVGDLDHDGLGGTTLDLVATG